MIVFVGAGPGAEDLITVRGQQYLKEADIIIYAGSLVNPGLLQVKKEGCEVYNSAYMTLEEVLEVMYAGEKEGKRIVRLHTGDPCLYGAIREQMDALEERQIPYEVCPGVSSFCGAAAALHAEYTLPDISQSVVITRMAGRTPVPDKESIRSFAAHQATMVIFLSTGMLGADGRGISGRHSGSDRVQGNLAGGKSAAMHGLRTGKNSGRRTGDKNSPDRGGKNSGRRI